MPSAAFQPEPDPDRRWLTVIGLGEDGPSSLGPEALSALEAAEAVVGGTRHLALIGDAFAPHASRHAWPSPMLPFVQTVIGWRGRRVVVLASGDPLLYGVAATFLPRVAAAEIRVIPAVSAFQLACAAMVWPQAVTRLVTACGRPVEGLALELFDGARIVLFSADGATPAAAARLLVAHGYGESRMTVLERLGSPAANAITLTASAVGDRRFDALNTIAVEAIAGPDVQPLPRSPGLPDDAFENDGQITRREIRAVTLARLAPVPGALLWDVGAGSGSIGIEWLRAGGGRAIGLEPRADRAARARENAARLGVPAFDIHEARAPEGLDGLPAPDAVFLGGGASVSGVIEASWAALKPGGRLVANAVTIETEARLFAARNEWGGELVRIEASYADAVGRMTGWRPAMPVTQYAVTKPKA
jgi:precorrin-6Y C5,15-methyltransferase (decarboxylating)